MGLYDRVCGFRSGKLETVFGTVSVERAGYGQQGVKSLHPLDAELNLP